MKKYAIYILILGLIIACKTPPNSTNINKPQYIVSANTEGLIDCFQPQWDSVKNRWTFCELSAALVCDNQIFTASDKSIPGHSSVFKLALKNDKIDQPKTVNYLDIELIKNAKKFEDFSISPDQKYIFLTTAFDRLKKDEWDAYNCLIAWPKDAPTKAQLLSESERNGVKSSLNLRTKIQAALADNNTPKGPKYFKIEGLAAAPDQQLIFGIREMGDKYDDFQYKITLLATHYEIDEKGLIKLEGDIRTIYEFNPYQQLYPELKLPIALSSIEYDRFNKHFYLCTSFEHENELGAYLWILNSTQLKKNIAPTLIKNEDGTPFEIQHKAEAVSIIDKNTILIVHDDDRKLINDRQPHQSAFQILNINRR